MNARRNIWLVILGGMLVIALSLAFSGCTQTPEKVSLVDVQAEIHTAVAATVDDLMPATQPAAETGAKTSKLSAAPVAAAPTDTQVPTPTDTVPPPTATSTPAQLVNTPTSTPVRIVGLEILAEQNTNCRLGPSTRYSVDGYLMVGMSSEVHGRTTDRSWWYIENPAKEGKFCWVWSGSTVVKGDSSDVAVVAAPELPKKSSSCWCGTYVYGKQLLNCKFGKTCKQTKLGCCEPMVVCQCQIVSPPNLCKVPNWWKKAYYGNYWTSFNFPNWCGW